MGLPGRFAVEQIQILTPATKTSYGKEMPDWGNTTPGEVITGCTVFPDRVDEFLEDRQAVIRRYVLRAPIAALPLFRTGGRVLWRGDVYRLMGAPEQWRASATSLSHIRVLIERVEG